MSDPPRYPPPAPPAPQPVAPAQPASAPAGVKPSTYWPLSIISFLCSLIIGAFAMYFSAQVTSRWREGNVEGSRRASKTALILGIVGIAIGVLVLFASLSSSGSY
jgi:hypothetical protein